MSLLIHFKKHLHSYSKSMFIKIFLSLITVSLLIIIILGIFIFFSVSQSLDDKINQSEQRKLSETINRISIFFDEIQKLSRSIENNERFVRFMPRSKTKFSENYQDYQDIRGNISTFVSIANSSNYLKDIFIYYRNSNYIISKQGLIDANLYYDHEWMDLFEKSNFMWHVMDTQPLLNRNNNIITMVTSIPYNHGIKQGAIVMYIDSQSVSNILAGILDDEKSHVFLLNSHNNIIASDNNANLYKNISEFVNVNSDDFANEKGIYHYTINNEKMTVFYNTSDINQWKLVYRLKLKSGWD